MNGFWSSHKPWVILTSFLLIAIFVLLVKQTYFDVSWEDAQEAAKQGKNVVLVVEGVPELSQDDYRIYLKQDSTRHLVSKGVSVNRSGDIIILSLTKTLPQIRLSPFVQPEVIVEDAVTHKLEYKSYRLDF